MAALRHGQALVTGTRREQHKTRLVLLVLGGRGVGLLQLAEAARVVEVRVRVDQHFDVGDVEAGLRDARDDEQSVLWITSSAGTPSTTSAGFLVKSRRILL